MMKNGAKNSTVKIEARIYNRQKAIAWNRQAGYVMKNAAKAAGKAVAESVGSKMDCSMDLFVVDNTEIRDLNLRYRNIDSATDVLSFPLLDVSDGIADPAGVDIDPESGKLLLGDLVISLEMAHAKSDEQKMSIDEEVAFLTIHGTLHLLGYDHQDEVSEAVMSGITARALIIAGYDELAADL